MYYVCMYYVCIYVCMYVLPMYVCTYVCMYVCTHASSHPAIYIPLLSLHAPPPQPPPHQSPIRATPQLEISSRSERFRHVCSCIRVYTCLKMATKMAETCRSTPVIAYVCINVTFIWTNQSTHKQNTQSVPITWNISNQHWNSGSTSVYFYLNGTHFGTIQYIYQSDPGGRAG